MVIDIMGTPFVLWIIKRRDSRFDLKLTTFESCKKGNLLVDGKMHYVPHCCCLLLFVFECIKCLFLVMGIAVGICGLCNHPHGAVTAPTW